METLEQQVNGVRSNAGPDRLQAQHGAGQGRGGGKSPLGITGAQHRPGASSGDILALALGKTPYFEINADSHAVNGPAHFE